ncbi:MAG: hypothetical protein AAFW87_08880 [Pseudomonadota bacterium]
MARWVWFVPLIGLVLCGVTLALLLGQRAATTTETEAIERVAAMHVAAGGVREDCKAVPAQSEGLWLVVTCEAVGGEGTAYFVDRFGEVVDTARLEGE